MPLNITPPIRQLRPHHSWLRQILKRERTLPPPPLCVTICTMITFCKRQMARKEGVKIIVEHSLRSLLVSFSPMAIYSGRLLLMSTSTALVRKRIGILVRWKNIGDLRCATISKSQRGGGGGSSEGFNFRVYINST